MESTGYRNRVNRSRISTLELPIKRAFSQKASRSKPVGFGKDSASSSRALAKVPWKMIDELGVRRGSHTAVRALEQAILDYLDHRNRDPKPFVWTADADLILGKA
jgi:hypothetical protein